jgi:hypothetical protein
MNRHSFRLALIAASSVAAVANSLATTAAASGNRCGCSTVGFSGQVTITTAGVSFASTSSTVTLWAVLIWPEARMVDFAHGIPAPYQRDLRPGRCSNTGRATPDWEVTHQRSTLRAAVVGNRGHRPRSDYRRLPSLRLD